MIRISALVLGLMAWPAMAQPAGDNLRRPFDPGDPAVQTAPFQYRSVFTPAPAQQPEISWPAANDEMAKLGGHAGQTREPARQSVPASAAPPAGRPTALHHQH